jgi:hypothetical protein
LSSPCYLILRRSVGGFGLSQLRVQLADAAGSIDVGETTTLEVLLDDEPRVRTQDADQEILDTCEYLQMVGAPVVLVTGDLGLTIRAVGRGIEVREMPQRYLR